jgi:hypothetical protein
MGGAFYVGNFGMHASIKFSKMAPIGIGKVTDW